jgi:WD40 repeat protein
LGKPPVTALAISPDGKSLFIGSQAGLEVRSWPDLASIRTVPTELAHVHDLAFSLDGKLLAAAGGAPAEHGTVEVYRWPSLALAYRRDSHKDVVYDVAWRGDSAVFAAASADAGVTVHDAATGKAIRQLVGHSRAVLTACYLPDGKGLVTGGADETLRLWDDRGEIARTLTNHTNAVNQVALRPQSEFQAQPMIASAGDDRTVRFWQPVIGRLVRFVRLDHPPLAIAWSADGSKVFAACSDGRLRTIDAETAEQSDVRDAIDGLAYAIAVAPDGSVVVGGANGQLRRLVFEGSAQQPNENPQ